ncbi:uncharacterized protein P884DRAFT_258631 [Thermothelomyces heterothallicus CBS 202.75]|uniref:uncharacterized protein n=1 Tax=Thermothelomyces heterothallicus CBS 202.75 TaxID=1149848 RepID=UPI0037424F1E
MSLFLPPPLSLTLCFFPSLSAAGRGKGEGKRIKGGSWGRIPNVKWNVEPPPNTMGLTFREGVNHASSRGYESYPWAAQIRWGCGWSRSRRGFGVDDSLFRCI